MTTNFLFASLIVSIKFTVEFTVDRFTANACGQRIRGKMNTRPTLLEENSSMVLYNFKKYN